MAIRKRVGPSKPEGEQLALPAIPTAAEKPAATDAPFSTLTGDDGDRTTASAEENRANRAPITAPEAANEDEPVPERPISSNTYVARRHLAMPANTDYWINDSSGDPLLVITGEVDAALMKSASASRGAGCGRRTKAHHRLRPRRLEAAIVRGDDQERLRRAHLSHGALSSHQ
jgi:hypothetical protein